MNDIYGEDEELRVLKQWWADNGTSLILTVVIGLGGLVGWNWWQANLEQRKVDSFAQFQGLVAKLDAIEQNPADEVEIAAADLLAANIKEQYPESYYASFAGFVRAKQAVADEDYAAALTELDWVIDQQPGQELTLIANLRKAQVQFAMGESDAALASLEIDERGSFVAAYAELQGDILMSSERYADAHAAYLSAAEAIANGTASQSPLLDTKLSYAKSFL